MIFAKGDTESHPYPHLTQISEALPPPLGLVDAITRTISEKGEVLDSASAKLTSTRSALRITHDRLMTKLQKIISNTQNQKVLQEEAGRIDPEVIRRQTSDLVSELEALSQATFSRWIDRFEIGARRHRLPSR